MRTIRLHPQFLSTLPSALSSLSVDPPVGPGSGPSPSGRVLQRGEEDQGDFFVSGPQQRKHPLGELGGCVEAVDL